MLYRLLMTFTKMWQVLFLAASVYSNAIVIDNIIEVDELTQGKDGDEKNVFRTEHGPVRGYENNGVLEFFDIPYGAFTAELPFQNPSKPQSWETTREKTEHSSRCPQVNEDNAYVGTIECLTLSIFKPVNATDADVVFHVHDSQFNSGSGDPLKYIPKRLVYEELIVVLPNYRLGPLGFLCLQNEIAPGNSGLKDLTLALEWTYNNVKTFGGKPSNIVVSGSGAGGALVEYLLLSQSSNKFISKAITESGFTLSPWALDRNPLNTATTLMNKLNRNESSNINITFKEVDIEVVTRASDDIHFRPCIELGGGFLNQTPWSLLKGEKFEKPLMLGSASQAAMEKALQYTEQTLLQLNDNTTLLLPHDLKFNSGTEKENIGKRVKDLYFGENNITINNLEILSQCLSDSNYLYPGIRGARLFLNGGAKVFFYEYSYGRTNTIAGAKRGDYVSHVFSKPEDTPASVLTMSNKILKLWSSFVKNGEPSVESIPWTNMTLGAATEEEWLSIGDLIRVQRGYHIERMKLWDEIYEKHYVELNSGFDLKPSIYITICCLILLLDWRKQHLM